MRDGQPQGDPESAIVLWAFYAVVIWGLGWAAWTFGKPQIAATVMATQQALAAFASLFTDRYDLILVQLRDADPAAPSMTIGRLYRLAHNVGAFYRLPAALLIAVLAALCFRHAEAGRFRRKLDLDGLALEQARVFGFTAAFATRRLRPVLPGPKRLRPADAALHPNEWTARFARAHDGGFDASGAEAELSRQLGPLWNGYASAPPMHRCLFAAFALHAARRREDAREVLGALSAGLAPAAPEGPAGPETPCALPSDLVRRIDAIMCDPKLMAPCGRVAARHAYANTALMSVLTYARERAGIINPGMFGFGALVDRHLFFALDTVPFPEPDTPWHLTPSAAPMVEAAGARAHWLAETAAGEPIRVPMVEAAAQAVRAAAEHNRRAARKTGP